MKPLNVGILLYENVGLLDFAGPLEVFSSAMIPIAKAKQEIKLFQPVTISKTTDPVKTSIGIQVLPERSFHEAEFLDILLIPGGPGALGMSEDSEEIRFIERMAERVELVATVSTGIRLALLAGIGVGKKVVTHSAHAYDLSKEFPGSVFDPTYRYLDEDTIVSSAGASAGLDLALYLIYKFFGDDAVEYASRKIEYVFTP